MKLYATVYGDKASGLRVSKGQGGQTYIQVKITDENRKDLYTIDCYPDTSLWIRDDKTYNLLYRYEHGVDKTKGEKKKGECANFEGSSFSCRNCGTSLGNHK